MSVASRVGRGASSRRRDLAPQVTRSDDLHRRRPALLHRTRVVGSSMLTLDGTEHRRHREPFAGPFRRAAVCARFAELVAQETERLIDAIEPAGEAELRRSLTGPLAVAAVTNALGLEDADAGAVLGWYERIVAAVTDITAGRPRQRHGARGLRGAVRRDQPGPRSRACRLAARRRRKPGRRLGARARGLQRRRAAVRRHRDDRRHDRQRRPGTCCSHPDQLELVKADAPPVAQRGRGVAAARARRRGHRPLCDRRRRARRRAIGRATSCASRSSAPTAIPAVFPDPDRFDVRRETRTGTWRSRTVRTSASGCTWRAWRPHTAVERLLRRLPATAPGPGSPAEPRGSCSASRPSCTSSGLRLVTLEHRSGSSIRRGSSVSRRSRAAGSATCPRRAA